MAFYNYDGVSIEGAIAAAEKKRWAKRSFLQAVFHYVFETNGCRRFVVRVEDTNQTALEFDKKLGFIHEGTLRKASKDGNDVHILGMLKSECRWLDGKQVKTKNASAA